MMSQIEQLIDIAIAEDIGDGDHSSLSCIPSTAQGQVKLMIKQAGVLAGMEIASLVYRKIDGLVEFFPHLPDGAEVNFGDIA